MECLEQEIGNNNADSMPKIMVGVAPFCYEDVNRLNDAVMKGKMLTINRIIGDESERLEITAIKGFAGDIKAYNVHQVLSDKFGHPYFRNDEKIVMPIFVYRTFATGEKCLCMIATYEGCGWESIGLMTGTMIDIG